MKRLFIIALSLLLPLYIFTWSRLIALTYVTSLTKTFALIFCIKLFVILLLLNERFFIKNRSKWTTILFGLIASMIFGAIFWVDTCFLFERDKLALLASWNKETVYQFIGGYVIPASIYGSCSIITGMLSTVSTRYLLNKFKVFKPNSEQ